MTEGLKSFESESEKLSGLRAALTAFERAQSARFMLSRTRKKIFDDLSKAVTAAEQMGIIDPLGMVIKERPGYPEPEENRNNILKEIGLPIVNATDLQAPATSEIQPSNEPQVAVAQPEVAPAITTEQPAVEVQDDNLGITLGESKPTGIVEGDTTTVESNPETDDVLDVVLQDETPPVPAVNVAESAEAGVSERPEVIEEPLPVVPVTGRAETEAVEEAPAIPVVEQPADETVVAPAAEPVADTPAEPEIVPLTEPPLPVPQPPTSPLTAEKSEKPEEETSKKEVDEAVKRLEEGIEKLPEASRKFVEQALATKKREDERIERRYGSQKNLYNRVKKGLNETWYGRAAFGALKAGSGFAEVIASGMIAGTPGMLLSPALFSHGTSQEINGALQFLAAFGEISGDKKVGVANREIDKLTKQLKEAVVAKSEVEKIQKLAEDIRAAEAKKLEAQASKFSLRAKTNLQSIVGGALGTTASVLVNGLPTGMQNFGGIMTNNLQIVGGHNTSFDLLKGWMFKYNPGDLNALAEHGVQQGTDFTTKSVGLAGVTGHGMGTAALATKAMLAGGIATAGLALLLQGRYDKAGIEKLKTEAEMLKKEAENITNPQAETPTAPLTETPEVKDEKPLTELSKKTGEPRKTEKPLPETTTDDESGKPRVEEEEGIEGLEVGQIYTVGGAENLGTNEKIFKGKVGEKDVRRLVVDDLQSGDDPTGKEVKIVSSRFVGEDAEVHALLHYDSETITGEKPAEELKSEEQKGEETKSTAEFKKGKTYKAYIRSHSGGSEKTFIADIDGKKVYLVLDGATAETAKELIEKTIEITATEDAEKVDDTHINLKAKIKGKEEVITEEEPIDAENAEREKAIIKAIKNPFSKDNVWVPKNLLGKEKTLINAEDYTNPASGKRPFDLDKTKEYSIVHQSGDHVLISFGDTTLLATVNEAIINFDLKALREYTIRGKREQFKKMLINSIKTEIDRLSKLNPASVVPPTKGPFTPEQTQAFENLLNDSQKKGEPITPEAKRNYEILAELYTEAGERTPEGVVSLLNDVDAIIDTERTSGLGKLREKIGDIESENDFLDGNVAFLADSSSEIIIGDTHGNPLSVVDVIEKERFIERVSSGENIKLVFLGDYVDRGPQDLKNLEIILDLKRKFPSHVILLRGNHDEGRGVSPYDFDKSVKKKYGDSSEAEELWKRYVETTKKLPLAVVTKSGILALHGGIGQFSSLLDLNLDENRETILWSDPSSTSGISSNRRGAGLNFGPDVVEGYLSNIGAKILVRAHEDKPTTEFNGQKVITVFSTGNPSPNPGEFSPTYLLVGEKGELNIKLIDYKGANSDIMRENLSRPVIKSEPDTSFTPETVGEAFEQATEAETPPTAETRDARSSEVKPEAVQLSELEMMIDGEAKIIKSGSVFRAKDGSGEPKIVDSIYQNPSDGKIVFRFTNTNFPDIIDTKEGWEEILGTAIIE